MVGATVGVFAVLSLLEGRNSKFSSSGGVTSGYWEWDDAGVDSGDKGRNLAAFVWVIVAFGVGEKKGVVSGTVFGFRGIDEMGLV